MKKTAIALAIVGLAAASLAQAAPQENTFYVGAKAGWSSFHDGLTEQAESYSATNATSTGFNRNSVTYGVFGGYQILNQNGLGLAAELGYDDFGRVKFREDGVTTGKHTNHGAHLSLKASYQVLDGLDVYGRVGAALIRSDYKEYSDGVKENVAHSLKVSPVYAAGLEYNLPSLPELALRVEYQWINKVGKLRDEDGNRVDYTPSISGVTAGLSYRFGQGAVPAVAPEVVNKTFTLNSDVTFAFGKSTLKPEAASTLDGIYGEISQVANPAVQVNGYADRIGKPEGNQKLSQRRAETVANYFVSKGLPEQAITAYGQGSTTQFSGNTCDAVKGRKALIACLAPDRRVDISVQGSKQVTM